MSKDTKKTNSPKKTLNLFEIPDSIIPLDKRIFFPEWNNRPPQENTVITLAGKRLLTVGNLFTLVSKAGTGKTSVITSIIASYLNPDCNGLGFTVQLPVSRNKILYIDTEQTRQDTWEMWEQTYKRAGIKRPTIDNKIIFSNFKAINITERKATVEKILKENNDIGLILFDGAGDFVRDINSINEASEFIDWINTFNPNISIATSLHTNPNDEKPRGHIGSELCRRAGSVLLIKKLDEDIRQITTDFIYGKVRKDADKISAYYKWSESESMFVSANDYTPPKAKENEKGEKYQQITKQLFAEKQEYSFSGLINKLMPIIGKDFDNSKQYFYSHLKEKHIIKEGENWKLR